MLIHTLKGSGQDGRVVHADLGDDLADVRTGSFPSKGTDALHSGAPIALRRKEAHTATTDHPSYKQAILDLSHGPR